LFTIESMTGWASWKARAATLSPVAAASLGLRIAVRMLERRATFWLRCSPPDGLTFHDLVFATLEISGAFTGH
jgi:hypothetical protein